MRRFIFFIISILCGANVIAQETESDAPADSLTVSTEQVEADTLITPKRIFSGISVTADIGKLGLGQLVNYEDKQAFSAHLLFMEKIQLSAEYGRGTISPVEAFKNVVYQVEGDYMRFGIDYVTRLKTKNFLSLGLRRASGTYSDMGTITVFSASDLSEDYVRTFSRADQTANWWEIVISSETKLTDDFTGKEDQMNILHKLLDNFYFGLHFRVRFALDYQVQEGVDTYTIPGYGRTFDNSVPAVSLYLRYRLGF